MHHKKKKAKNQRAGCLMCKPNKMNGWNKDKLGHTGFSKLKHTEHAKEDWDVFVHGTGPLSGDY